MKARTRPLQPQAHSLWRDHVLALDELNAYTQGARMSAQSQRKTTSAAKLAATPAEHKQLSAERYRAAFALLGDYYYPNDTESRAALVWLMRHFNAPEFTGNIVHDGQGPKVSGSYDTTRRDAARPFLATEQGRRDLAEFIANHLLKHWPLVTAGVDADQSNSNWRTEFVCRFFAANPTQLRYEDLTCLLVFDPQLRAALARLAYAVCPKNPWVASSRKAKVHLRNALVDGFARIMGAKPCMPGKQIRTRRLVAGLASDFLADSDHKPPYPDWKAMGRKERCGCAAEYLREPQLGPKAEYSHIPELAPTANTKSALGLISNATRDACVDARDLQNAQASLEQVQLRIRECQAGQGNHRKKLRNLREREQKLKDEIRTIVQT